jgi:hypothetical protein
MSGTAPAFSTMYAEPSYTTQQQSSADVVDALAK